MFTRIGAIIIGAGRSQRIGVDKTFLPLAGKPLLAWSVDVCQTYEALNQIILVLNANNLDSGRRLAIERRWSKITEVCLGGQRRQDSVMQGLRRLEGCDWVIIHDSARPFLTIDLLQDGLEAAKETGAAIAAVPVKDTIKLSNNNAIVKETLQRQQLWTVQTPQIFHFDIITKAHKQITDEATDDASLVEKLGYKVKLYMGSYNNIKVTTPEDMILAELIARSEENNESRNRL